MHFKKSSLSSLYNVYRHCGRAHVQGIVQLRPRKLGHVALADVAGSCVAYSLQAKICHTTWAQFKASLSFQINREGAPLAVDLFFTSDDTFSYSWKRMGLGMICHNSTKKFGGQSSRPILWLTFILWAQNPLSSLIHTHRSMFSTSKGRQQNDLARFMLEKKITVVNWHGFILS